MNITLDAYRSEPQLGIALHAAARRERALILGELLGRFIDKSKLLTVAHGTLLQPETLVEILVTARK